MKGKTNRPCFFRETGRRNIDKLLLVGVVEWEMLRCVRRERIYAFRNVARSTRERWMAALWI